MVKIINYKPLHYAVLSILLLCWVCRQNRRTDRRDFMITPSCYAGLCLHVTPDYAFMLRRTMPSCYAGPTDTKLLYMFSVTPSIRYRRNGPAPVYEPLMWTTGLDQRKSRTRPVGHFHKSLMLLSLFPTQYHLATLHVVFYTIHQNFRTVNTACPKI
jgi:hypothetical protein